MTRAAFDDGDRAGRFVIPRDREGVRHAMAAGAVVALWVKDNQPNLAGEVAQNRSLTFRRLP